MKKLIDSNIENKINDAVNRRKCPNCGSKRLEMKDFSGGKKCRRCNCRWSSDGTVNPFFDKRLSLKKKK